MIDIDIDIDIDISISREMRSRGKIRWFGMGYTEVCTVRYFLVPLCSRYEGGERE